jgi:hypothetical protein
LTAGSLPTVVAAFIADHIGSVLQLEVLLMFHAQADRLWTRAEIAAALGVGSEWAALQLTYLERHGLLAREQEAYRFSAAMPELAAAVAALSREYSQRRVTVVSAIYANRPSPLQSFSEAFRLKGEKKEGGAGG